MKSASVVQRMILGMVDRAIDTILIGWSTCADISTGWRARWLYSY